MTGRRLNKLFSTESIVGDVRSALVGSVVGSITGIVLAFVVTSCSASKEYTTFPSKDGYTQPFTELVYRATAENPKLKVAFVPPELSNAYVCEYVHLTGPTNQDLLFQYVTKFKDCFLLRQKDENSFSILKNTDNDKMSLTNGSWMCMCP